MDRIKKRISIHRYAHDLAHVVASRSEDPFRQTGAVAFTRENRIIATGYNGLAPGRTLPLKIWKNREARLQHVIHAEQNLCSLFKRGEASWVYVTISPCHHCLKLLEAHGISQVIFTDHYDRENIWEVAKYVNIEILQYELRKDRVLAIANCF